MRAIIASDNPTLSMKLRHAVVQLGYGCNIADVTTIEDSAALIATMEHHPDFILVVLPEELSRCLQTLAHFNEVTTARILAVGPGNDPQVILSAVQAGADHYLDKDEDIQQQLGVFLSRLTAKRESAASNGNLTLVASVGGGCGASVVASNLSVLIAQDREECTLLDLDRRCGDQAPLFNLQPRHTLAQICDSIDSCDANMLRQSLTLHDSGVQVLSAPLRLEDNRHLAAEGIRKIVKLARSASPDVVVDLGSVADGGDRDLLQSADRILLVFRQDFPSLRRLMLILEQWDEFGVDAHAVNLVANSCGQAKCLPMSKIQSALRRDVVMTIPDDRYCLNVSVNAGIPVVLESPKSSFAQSVRDLAIRTGLLSQTTRRKREPRESRKPAIVAKILALIRGLPSTVATETN